MAEKDTDMIAIERSKKESTLRKLLLFMLIFVPWVFYVFKRGMNRKFFSVMKKSNGKIKILYHRLWCIPLLYYFYIMSVYFGVRPLLRKLFLFTGSESFVGALSNVGYPFNSFFEVFSSSLTIWVFFAFIPFISLLLLDLFGERYYEKSPKHIKELMKTNVIIPIRTKEFLRKEDRRLIPRKSLFAGLLFCGQTGSGKTLGMQEVVSQLDIEELLLTDKTEPKATIFFDPKKDYREEFAKPDDIVISIHPEECTHSWNIFDEIDSEDDFDELAQEIFKPELKASENDQFWNTVAGQIFGSLLKKLYRDAKGQGTTATNADLYNTVKRLNIKDIHTMLSREPEFANIVEHIDQKSGGQKASSVASVFTSKFESAFAGSFHMSDKPSFSIRRYFENPGRQQLFLLYDIKEGERSASVFRLLLDWASKQALRNENKDYKKYFICDEFWLLPRLTRYVDLLNYGRTFGVMTVSGVQSVAQVSEKYGEDITMAILSGHHIKFILRSGSGDKKTLNFVKDSIGIIEERQPRREYVTVGKSQKYLGTTYSTDRYFPFRESDLMTFGPGECLFITDYGYERIQLKKYIPRKNRKVLTKKSTSLPVSNKKLCYKAATIFEIKDIQYELVSKIEDNDENNIIVLQDPNTIRWLKEKGVKGKVQANIHMKDLRATNNIIGDMKIHSVHKILKRGINFYHVQQDPITHLPKTLIKTNKIDMQPITPKQINVSKKNIIIIKEKDSNLEKWLEKEKITGEIQDSLTVENVNSNSNVFGFLTISQAISLHKKNIHTYIFLNIGDYKGVSKPIAI